MNQSASTNVYLLNEDTKRFAEQKINQHVAEFRQHLELVVNQVADEDMVSQFTEEAMQVLTKLNRIEQQLLHIDKIISKLNQQEADFSEEVAQLKAARAVIAQELNDIADKTSDFIANVGKFVGAGVRRAVNGLPVG